VRVHVCTCVCVRARARQCVYLVINIGSHSHFLLSIACPPAATAADFRGNCRDHQVVAREYRVLAGGGGGGGGGGDGLGFRVYQVVAREYRVLADIGLWVLNSDQIVSVVSVAAVAATDTLLLGGGVGG